MKAWWLEAACRGMDPNVFFTESKTKVAKAKAICAECPVREDCLADALEMPEHLQEYGIRAGLTPSELLAYRGGTKHKETADASST